jgi:pimeloyl-ACP methyl ester carboxylesterase
MRKLRFNLLLVLAVFVFATWQYRLLMVLLWVVLNKRSIKASTLMQRYRHSYEVVVGALLLAIFVAIPNYTRHGRSVVIYMDKQGKAIATPLAVYAINAILPEEEIFNFGFRATPLLQLGTSNRFVHAAAADALSLRGLTFYRPYNRLSRIGSNPGSYAITQTMNQVLGTDYEAISVTRTAGSSKEKLPVVFFCHGYLGSWELYQGILSHLKGCIVVSIGTHDLNGNFNQSDINKIFTKYLPLLREQGYPIDEEQLHIMGLSNGGTAGNIALGYYSNRFRTITFISTSCAVRQSSHTKVILIGGGRDSSSNGLPGAYSALQRGGTRCAMLYDKEENHFIIVHKAKEVCEFLNQEMGLQ